MLPARIRTLVPWLALVIAVPPGGPARADDTDARSGDTVRGIGALPEAHALQRAEKIEALASCDGEGTCEALFTAIASASRTALLMGEADPAEAEWRGILTCTGPLEPCLTRAFPGLHVLRAVEDVTVLRADGDIARYVPERLTDEDGRPVLYTPSAPPLTLTLADAGLERDPLARKVLAQLPPQIGHASANVMTDRADARVLPVTGTRWLASKPVIRPPTIVCADGRLLREPLVAHGIVPVADPLPFGLRQTAPAWPYTLPCEAVLVVGADVPGVDGERWTPRHTTPVPDGPGRFRVADLPVQATDVLGLQPGRPPLLEPCAVTLGGRVEGGRMCRLTVVGDLNGDGRTDAWIEWTGEMGCGGSGLYLSDPWGPHRQVSREFHDC